MSFSLLVFFLEILQLFLLSRDEIVQLTLQTDPSTQQLMLGKVVGFAPSGH